MMFSVTYLPTGMGGWTRAGWPDGRSTLRQPVIALQAFAHVQAAIMFASKKAGE